MPFIEKRQSRISGSGVFATRPIPRNTFIVEYKGQKISAAESDRREKRYLARGRIWCFELSARTARDAAFGGNVGRYVNHACHPNCYVEIFGHHIWILASRDIRKGEELTYDYNTDGVAGIPCRCRPGCRRVI